MFPKLFRKKPRKVLAHTAPDAKGSFCSHALMLIREKMEGRANLVFLDLGNGTTSTIETLSDIASRVVFASVPQQMLDRHNSGAGHAADTAIEQSSLSTTGEKAIEPYQVIFCWDLFDYLSEAGVQTMLQQLLHLTTRDSLVHLIISSLPNHADTPSAFEIFESTKIRYASGSEELVPCPQHSLRKLIELFDDFEVEHLGRFRSGYVEMLFRRKGNDEMKTSDEVAERSMRRRGSRRLLVEELMSTH